MLVDVLYIGGTMMFNSGSHFVLATAFILYVILRLNVFSIPRRLHQREVMEKLLATQEWSILFMGVRPWRKGGSQRSQ